MKFVLLALALSSPVQAPLKLERVFKLGEVDRYTTRLSIAETVGDIDITLVVEQKVLKVHSDGTAEVESALADLKTSLNGAPMEAERPQNGKVVFRMTKSGLAEEPVTGGDTGMSFLNFIRMVPDKPLKLGEPTPISMSDPKNAKRSVQGTVTLQELASGIAKLGYKWQVTTADAAKPLQLDMTAFVDVATGKFNKGSGTIMGAPSKGLDVRAIQFSMERS